MAPKKRAHWDAKTNEEYPLFAFRTYGPKDKEELNDRIDGVTEIMNRTRAVGEKKLKKQDVIIQALNKGLDILREEARKKK